MLYGVGHLLDDLHHANASGTDPLQQVDDVFFVVGKFIGVEELGDRRSFSLLLFVLSKHSFQNSAVSQAIRLSHSLTPKASAVQVQLAEPHPVLEPFATSSQPLRPQPRSRFSY